MNNKFASVVIVAAGKGTRMNMDINKQYIEVCDKPVLARTIQTFEACRFIHEIIVVVNGQEMEYCKNAILDTHDFTKVKMLVAGGSERQHSVYNGLAEVSKHCDVVLIHDGARPFVKEESIYQSIEAALAYGAATVAVPVKDTIKRADEEGYAKETLDRSTLWSIQTPQAFRYKSIMEAHHSAQKEGYLGTDDAVLAERIGLRPKLVMGSYDNIKITTKEDLIMAEAIVAARER